MRIAECGLRNEKQGGIRDADCESPTPNSEQSPPSNVVLGGTPHSKGFTLIEIVVTIVIIGIIAGIAAMIILQGAKMYSTEDIRSDVHYQAKLAVERMAREVRLARSRAAVPVDDIPAMTGTTLEFYDIGGTLVGFQLSGGNLQRRENSGAWQTLATNITGPGGNIFTYLDNTGAGGAAQAALWSVQIDLTATQGTESLDLRTTVHPMNF